MGGMKEDKLTKIVGIILGISLITLFSTIGIAVILGSSEKKIEIFTIFTIILLSSLVSVVCMSILVVKSIQEHIKQAKKDKKAGQKLLIGLWKWINIISIVSGIIILITSFIRGEFFIARVWQERINFVMPIEIMSLSFITGFVLSVLIVYGITKKKVIGYYASLVSIGHVLVFNLVYLITSDSKGEFITSLIGIIIYSTFGYFLYRGKKYFVRVKND